VAGARNFDRVALGSCGIPAFEVGVNGSVFGRDQHPARFTSPCSCGDGCLEIVSQVQYLRTRHESGLFGRQVGCEVLLKMRGIEVGETVCRFLYRTRFAEVTWEALAVVSLVLSGIWHVGRNVHQTGDGWIGAGFRDDSSAIAMPTRMHGPSC